MVIVKTLFLLLLFYSSTSLATRATLNPPPSVAHRECHHLLHRKQGSDQLHEKIDQIYSKMPDTLRAMIHHNPDWSVFDFYAYVVHQTEAQHQALVQLMEELPSDVYKKAVKSALKEIKVHRFEKDEMWELHSKPRFNFSIRRTNSHLAQYSERIFDRVSGIIARSRGFLGELKAAFQAPGLTTTNKSVGRLISESERKTLSRFLKRADFERVIGYEIDIVFQHGQGWAEVKNRISYRETELDELYSKLTLIREAMYVLNREHGTQYRLALVAPLKSLPGHFQKSMLENNILAIEMGWPESLWQTSHEIREMVQQRAKPRSMKNKRRKKKGRKKEGRGRNGRERRTKKAS